ncbi:MAG: hypothetical protein WA003_06465 [Desulfuromonadaceae bacterium]
MIRSLIFMLLIATLLAGCSAVKVVPEQTGSGRVNVVDNSQTIITNGVEVTARVDETAINSYNLDSTVTAFHIAIRNTTDKEISFGDDSYVLVDESGLQYSLLTPENVRSMLKKDSYYLIPYPYVGFYYLEDYEKTNAYNRLNSSQPYYYELYPQDIYTMALQATTVIPGMKVEGLTYFKIDPAAHQKVNLLIFQKGASKSSPPDFNFPFKVVK